MRADVVRHHLVQRIIRAYDEHKTRLAEQQTLSWASRPKSGCDARPGRSAAETGESEFGRRT